VSLATSAGDYNTPFLTSNRFVLVHYPVVGNPEISISAKSKKIQLKPDMTLSDLERELKANRDAKRTVEFLAEDGVPVAKSTILGNLLDLPHFLVKIDGAREYNFISEKSFSFKNTKMSMNASEKGIFDHLKEFPMRD